MIERNVRSTLRILVLAENSKGFANPLFTAGDRFFRVQAILDTPADGLGK